MGKCYDCDKVYRGGKGWRIDRGFNSTYFTCPICLKQTNLNAGYTDLRVKNE
jgi:hypothetical protein